ncbi:hypothetical protein C0Q70_01298 [Pomacea canaliculata]|uniref:Large ribosomal subunit protein mL62 n=1 Tax=Pomacea canaliculata TaxID=400727 RepID=A0A2T7PZ35_POMCA|nr:hypothetical protein C0Q70_01298 [Pomacea canaliculata]
MTEECKLFSHHVQHTDARARPDTSSVDFAGYIPVNELDISYARSSGPGGQNVNKVNTKVEVRFHLQSASWLSQEIKDKLKEMESNKITKDGYLVVSSERTRIQLLNQADCMDKLRTMIFRAAIRPRGLTQEEIQLRDKRLAKAKEQTLLMKRTHSLTKQNRGSM